MIFTTKNSDFSTHHEYLLKDTDIYHRDDVSLA